MKLFNFLKPESQFEEQIMKLDGIEMLDIQEKNDIIYDGSGRPLQSMCICLMRFQL